MKWNTYLVCIALLITSCVPTRYIQPLQEKEHAVSFSLGGPFFSFSGMTIPAPLSSLSYGYGLKDKLTVFGGLNTTSLAFGNFQTDFGTTYQFIEQENFIPNISASLAGNLIFNFDEANTHFWPQLDVNAYWEHGKNKSYFYVGMSNWFELAAKRAHDEASLDRWLLHPQLGYQYNFDRWSFFAEIKLLAPSHRNTDVLIDYKSITGDYGSTGLYFGLIKKF
jgi:hypothetical protein